MIVLSKVSKKWIGGDLFFLEKIVREIVVLSIFKDVVVIWKFRGFVLYVFFVEVVGVVAFFFYM